MAAWDQFKALTGALGIQFEAGVNFVDLYENDPGGEGVLTDSTTGQFTDNTIFWIERVRWITSSDSFQIHRGGSTVNAGTYLGGLADTWTLYILDEDDDQYIALRANSLGNNTSQNGKWDEATWVEVSIALRIELRLVHIRAAQLQPDSRAGKRCDLGALQLVQDRSPLHRGFVALHCCHQIRRRGHCPQVMLEEGIEAGQIRAESPHRGAISGPAL